ERDRVTDPKDIRGRMCQLGHEPTFEVDHKETLMPELDIDSQGDPLDVEGSRGQAAPRDRQRAAPPLIIIACQRADAALFPGPCLCFDVIPAHRLAEHFRSIAQDAETVARTPRILNLAAEEPFVARLQV